MIGITLGVFLPPLLLLVRHAVAQNSTVPPAASGAGGGLPPPVTANNPCGVSIQASPSICNRLIAKSMNLTCECYNFCDGRLAGCYKFGESPLAFECANVEDAVTGCRLDFEGSEGAGDSDLVAALNMSDESDVPCPPGFLCDRGRQRSCDIVRSIPIALGLGDVHAGMYCPGRVDRKEIGYTNCPVGSYCPNSTTILPCPEGYFCPHKTAKPEIECQACSAGSKTMKRHMYGYIGLGLACGLVLVFLVWEFFILKNKRLYAKIVEMQDRNYNGVKDAINFRTRQRKLQELKPKLQVIETRLQELTGDKNTKALSTDAKDGFVRFDARLLFDALDADDSGDLDYKELNGVLKLKRVQLREFIRRMNQAADESERAASISRAVFVKNFLRVLEVTSHFEPTPNEAKQLFAEIAEQGTAANGEVPHKNFFNSSLCDFLSETQIHDLLKRFQDLKELPDEEAAKSLDRADSRVDRRSLLRHRASVFGLSHISHTIGREEFVAKYPQLLMEIISKEERQETSDSADAGKGIDIAFEDLSLTVKVKDSSIKVVNNVSGRLCAGSMTALMGGSGAGKTSLLNALCGRAFYGEITGDIRINGHQTSIEEHSSAVGFVPQDDIVYAELTVRENLVFSGKFQLPEGTPMEEIEELAERTIASLGLSRVMHSMVGDVHRRGVSGGEKKRVNIGLELMKTPRVLFLDEPTSGLDSSSALLVMQSLKNLVNDQGVTICSVIHQPRKFIFELFDSLILLGAGGHLVYHGKVSKVTEYFFKLNYELPPGESIADWLIDISSGRLEPSYDDDKSEAEVKPKRKKKKIGARTSNMSDTEDNDSAWPADNDAGGGAAALLASNTNELEKVRREHLYKHWRRHFDNLSKKKRAQYKAPKPSPLPEARKKPPFFKQMSYQIQRLFILAERNWYSKLIDTSIIIGAVVLVSLLDGVAEQTSVSPRSISSLRYDSVAEPRTPQELVEAFPIYFEYAIHGIQSNIVQYNAKMGVIVAVLVGLTATKVITDKRNEFFRESGSGYDINAYFCAINIVATIEHSIQVIIASMFALWLRMSFAVWYNYLVNFLMLAWLCVSWALLFPLIVPEKSVVLVTGFYMTFFALLFSGGISPVLYKDIYASDGIALFSGLLSPTRYFIEAMTVAEARCLPVQSGFTSFGRNFRNEEALQASSFQILGLGLNDFDNVTDYNCNGWYWGILPAFFVGLSIRWLSAGLIHVSDRPKQAKKPILQVLARSTGSQCTFTLFLSMFISLVAVSIFLMLRTASEIDDPITFGNYSFSVEEIEAFQEEKENTTAGEGLT